jgi:hypothetical protein
MDQKYAKFGLKILKVKDIVKVVNNYHYGPISQKALQLFFKNLIYLT